MAMACLRLVTFLPLRPDFSLPFFIACISRFTSLPEDGEYLRVEDFFAGDFLAEVFFAEVFFAELFFAPLFFALDFLAAFLVAILYPPNEYEMAARFRLLYGLRTGG